MPNRPIVVHTAIINGYDDAPNIIDRSSEIDFVLVTDKAREVEGWRTALVERYWKDDKLNSGFVKTHPEYFADPDSIVVWVDANVKDLRIDPQEIRKAADQGALHALVHRVRESVASEREAVISSRLADPWRVARQAARQTAEGFHDEDGLSATMFIIRDLADPAVHQFNAAWWRELVHGCRRDQLGFDFAAWKTGVRRGHLDLDWREPNSVFTRVAHTSPTGRTNTDLGTAMQTDFLPQTYPAVQYFFEEWTSTDLAVMQQLNATVVRTGEKMEGNYCHMHHVGISELTPPDPRRSWKREFFRQSLQGVERFLEVGFNAGHSTALALLEHPAITTVSLDLGEHEYARLAAGYLEERFPGRTTFIWGDSGETLSEENGLRASDFDLVHIDGGHGAAAFEHDLGWFMSSSVPGSRVLVDDSYVPRIAGPLDRLVSEGKLNPESRGLISSGENRSFVRI